MLLRDVQGLARLLTQELTQCLKPACHQLVFSIFSDVAVSLLDAKHGVLKTPFLLLQESSLKMCILNEHTENKRPTNTAANFPAFAHIPATVHSKISLSSAFAVVPLFPLSNNLRDKMTEQIRKISINNTVRKEAFTH